MAALLSIPFEVHVSIVRKLSLKDCISYMQVCTVTYDVVCYVFAHRKELDFQSVLDESGTIALRPEVLMRVLYAHTRAVSIMNFCFNPTFTLLNEFFRYFSIYWSYKVVDIQQFDPCLQEVGHPSGHLQRIRYLGWDGGSTQEQSIQLWSLWNSSQDWYMEVDGPICSHDDRTTSYLSSTEPNWSSVDLDAPYTWCWECKGVCTCKVESDGGSTNLADNKYCETDEYQSCTQNENECD